MGELPPDGPSPLATAGRSAPASASATASGGPIGAAVHAPDALMSAHGEDAEWFRRLPPQMQDEYRARWAASAARGEGRTQHRKRSVGSGALRAAIVFALTYAMFGFGGPLGFLVAAPVGAGLGCLWVLWDLGPIRCGVTAAPVWAAVWLAFVPGDMHPAGVVAMLSFSLLICVPLAMAAGHVRLMRQSDGEE